MQHGERIVQTTNRNGSESYSGKHNFKSTQITYITINIFSACGLAFQGGGLINLRSWVRIPPGRPIFHYQTPNDDLGKDTLNCSNC